MAQKSPILQADYVLTATYHQLQERFVMAAWGLDQSTGLDVVGIHPEARTSVGICVAFN